MQAPFFSENLGNIGKRLSRNEKDGGREAWEPVAGQAGSGKSIWRFAAAWSEWASAASADSGRGSSMVVD